MNARQLRAKRRRQGQKRKKAKANDKEKEKEKALIRQNNCTAAADANTWPQSSPSPQPLLNKRVTFDHFTFNSTGVILIPLTGTIIKIIESSSEDILSILIDHNEHQSFNKRTQSLFSGTESNLIEATASSLLNFKLKY